MDDSPGPTARQVEGLRVVAEEFGTPTYAYDLSEIRARAAEVRETFGDWLGISYAVKANPNRALVRAMAGLADHLDVSSGGEVILAGEAGWAPADLTFVGPAKADWELELAVERSVGLVVVESEGELERLDGIARASGRCVPIAVRINPVELPEGFGVSMSRRATVFGVDEEDVDRVLESVSGFSGVRLSGLHVYAGTQCLSEQALAANLINIARLFGELIERHGLQPSLLIFGSGFGIPYHERDRAIDLPEVASMAGAALEEIASVASEWGGALSLEMGRYLVGRSGFFLSRVLGIKETRGSRILALDGGMNHHLAASGNLGGVIKRNYPIHNLTRHTESGETLEYDVAGPLCTNVDTLARSARLPETRVGDVLAIGSSGAYGLTASPLHFISHRPPVEALFTSDEDGGVIDVTSEGTVARPIPFPKRTSESDST